MKEKEILKYDYITEDMFPEKNSKEYEDFKKQVETDGTMWLTLLEYLRYKKFQKDHLDCLRDPVTKLPKFGAIGGGTTCSFILTGTGHKVIVGCSGCRNDYEITEGTVNNNVYDEVTSDELPKTQEEMDAFMEKTHWGRMFKLNDVEFLRLCKFKEDFSQKESKGDLVITFRPTGLGELVAVRYSGLKQIFSITDSTYW